LLTDVGLDLRTRVSSRLHAQSLASVLDGVTGASGVAAAWRSVATDSSVAFSDTEFRRLTGMTIGAVDSRLAVAGLYLEAARAAGLGGDTTFFNKVSDNAVVDLENDGLLDASTRQMIRRFATALDARPRDPRALGEAAHAILQTLAQ